MFQVAQRPSQRSRSCLALALVALPVVNRDDFALHRHCRYPTNLLVKESFIVQQYPLESSSFSSALLSSTRSLQPRRVALRQERVVLWSSVGFHLTLLMSNRHSSHHQKMSCRDWRQRRSMRVRCSRPAIVPIRQLSSRTWGFLAVSPHLPGACLAS